MGWVVSRGNALMISLGLFCIGVMIAFKVGRNHAHHKSRLTFSVIRSYLFDKLVKTNGNIPRVKAYWGRELMIE